MMLIAFFCTVIFGVLLYVFRYVTNIIVVFVVGMRTGVALAMNGIFLIVINFFPARYKGTVFSITGFISGITSSVGPIIAEID